MNKRLELALHWIENEYLSATKKFGNFHNAHEGYAVLLEEVDELWEGVKLKQTNTGREAHLVYEAIHVAAMALRFIMDCCGDNGP